jgi:hypothetical protein
MGKDNIAAPMTDVDIQVQMHTLERKLSEGGRMEDSMLCP